MLANILIVESEPSVRKLLQRALERVGYAVQGVGTDVEALRLCRTGPVDLVLADVGLPATGHELARTVAMQCPRTRVVLMAARYSECDDCPYVSQCRTIAKPFQMESVVATIGEVLAAPLQGTRGAS